MKFFLKIRNTKIFVQIARMISFEKFANRIPQEVCDQSPFCKKSILKTNSENVDLEYDVTPPPWRVVFTKMRKKNIRKTNRGNNYPIFLSKIHPTTPHHFSKKSREFKLPALFRWYTNSPKKRSASHCHNLIAELECTYYSRIRVYKNMICRYFAIQRKNLRNRLR